MVEPVLSARLLPMVLVLVHVGVVYQRFIAQFRLRRVGLTYNQLGGVSPLDVKLSLQSMRVGNQNSQRHATNCPAIG